MVEILDEPIPWVVARFERGAIHPLKFRWGSRDFVVTSVNARWVDRSSRPIKYGFAVTVASGEVMELGWREGDSVWRLSRVDAE